MDRRGEGTAEVLENLLPFALCFHVKELISARNDGYVGFSITGAPLGEGRLDLEGLIRRYHAANPRANLILEQWVPWQGAVAKTIDVEKAWADRSMSRLMKAAAELPEL